MREKKGEREETGRSSEIQLNKNIIMLVGIHTERKKEMMMKRSIVMEKTASQSTSKASQIQI